MNLLLIDDHFCAREGVACLLKQLFSDLQVFEAESFDEGLAIAWNEPLNMVLLDIQLPGKNGMTGLEELRKNFPNLCVVMFSGLDDKELVIEALRLGAMGFIAKTLSRHEFIEALRDVLSGCVYLPASVMRLQMARETSGTGIRPVSDPAGLGLTPREFEVVGWLIQGKCNKEIARRLMIEEQTVKNHLRPIFLKFGVTRRTQLMATVFEKGVVFGRPEVGN
jgi:DNA-binding NarL/FixJ family response regulator